MSDPSDTDRQTQALRALVREHGRQPLWSLAAVLAGVLQMGATIALSWLLARVLHGLAIEGLSMTDLRSEWLWILPCIALRSLAGWLREEAGLRLSQAVRQSLRETLMDALHRLGPAWVARQQVGALSSTLLDQIEALDGYFARYRPQQWHAVLAPLMILAVVFPLSWAAGLILLATAPLIPVFMILVGWGARDRQTEQLQALQRMSGHFLDMLRGLPTLRLMNAHGRLAAEVAQVADAFRERTMRVLRLGFLSGTVLELFASIAVAMSAVYFGLSLLGMLNFGLYGQALTLQVALFALLLAPEFYLPLRELGTHYHARAQAQAAAIEIERLLHATSLQPPDGLGVPLRHPPALRLQRVVFAHRDGEPVLRGCSLQVAAGEAVAIQGPSGGGKTSLLRLLLGQLQAQQGEVFVDEAPMASLDLSVWRERIGWMSQHPRLLADTLAANLRIARLDASDAELFEALFFAGLRDWFTALPEGLQTRLGEGGRSLSGGQLRRLALARVRLRRADLLLLDEPTASLDTETEAQIVERIAELRQGRTLVLLTHRPAPLRIADRVLRLSEGQLHAVAPSTAPLAVPALAGEPLRTARPDTPRRTSDAPVPTPAAPANDRLGLPDGLRALAPFWRRLSVAGPWLALGLLLGLVTLASHLTLLGVSGAYLTGAAIAGLVPATAIEFNFFYPGAAVRLSALLRAVSRWGDRVLTHEGIFRWLTGLRVWLYGRLSQLSPRQLQRHHGGDLLNRLVQDIDSLDNLHPRVLMPLLAAITLFIGVTLLFAWVAPTLLWLPLMLLVVTVLVLPLAGWRLGRSLQPRLVRQRAALRTQLLDSCEGLEDFSLHTPAWARQRQHTLAASASWLRTQLSSGRRAAALRALVAAGIGLAAWVALGWLGGEPTESRLSVPWIAALVLLLMGCAEALLPLAGACLELPGTAAAARRIRDLAEQPPAQHFPAQGPTPADSGIDIRHLRFAWDAHTPVFEDLTLRIAPGEHLMLCGESGGGKSSLLQLLTRFEDPQGGEIRFGGVDLMALDEDRLRQHVTCATQFTWAKTATLAENLRLARPQASDAEIEAMLALVGLDPLAQGWQDGIHTWVEEGGASLSGGQRRRLSVARALMRQAPVTLLDEPSEGLDSVAEAALVRAVTGHLRGRTLVWVSHREELAPAFDRVLRF